MAPQNVSFIDSSAEDEDVLSKGTSKLYITSGSKTYRVHSHGQGAGAGGAGSGSDHAANEASPSPTRMMHRPTLSSAFKQHKLSGGGSAGPSSLRSNSGAGLTEEEAEALAMIKTEKLKDDADASKGFVISFDSDTPKKPKPQLKQRRLSSKKNSLSGGFGLGGHEMSSDGSNSSRKENVPPELMICIDMNTGDESAGSNDMRTYSRGKSATRDWRSYHHSSGADGGDLTNSDEQESPAGGAIVPKFEVDPNIPMEAMVAMNSDESDGSGGGVNKMNTGLIIGDGMVQATDPGVMSEMQRKKERIMLQSLRRKQQAEENRLRKNDEERRRKAEEAKKEEEKARKKLEASARREAILEEYRLKKERDQAAEEVRTFSNQNHLSVDCIAIMFFQGLRMPEPVSARPVPKLRAKSASKSARPRPKTIHVDQDADVNASLGARGPRGSSSNISGKRPIDFRFEVKSHLYSPNLSELCSLQS